MHSQRGLVDDANHGTGERLMRAMNELQRRPAALTVLAAAATTALLLFVVRTSPPAAWVLAVVGILGAYVLLTHTTAAERATAQLVFDRAGVGLARVRLDGSWLEVNQAYCDILGYPPAELLGRRFQDLTHPDDLEEDLEHTRRLIRGAVGSYALEKRYIRKNGEPVWVELVKTLARTPDGEPSYMIASAIDISSRKAAEHARDEARALVDALYVQAPIGLGYYDRSLRCVLANEALTRMAGLSVAAHLGSYVGDILPGPLGEGVAEDMRRVIETGVATARLPLEVALPPSYEAEDWIISYFPVRVGGAEVVGVGCIAQAITHQRRTERERERLVVELREAVRARDDFLSIASHELRTPLTTLMLGSEHLMRLCAGREPPPASTLLGKVERIHAQGKRLERLVGTLLDVARIAQGRVELFPEQLDVAFVVRDQVMRLEENAAKAGSTVTVDAPSPIVGRFDRTRLEQIVDNLVANAIKFGSGKSVEVAVHATDQGVRLTVRDHGLGIAKEDRARIFERFEQAISERHYGGLGLGLWVTRQIVEAMGGTVFVTGEVGEGSTFIVEWPS
jgi:PAS domain S-box-containing protein